MVDAGGRHAHLLQPVHTTSNAYFAIWAAFIISLLLLSSSFTRVERAFRSMSSIRDEVGVKAMLGLCVSSAIVLFSTIEYVAEGIGEATFGLIAAIFSTLLAALLYFLHDRQKVGPRVKKLASLFFVGLWCAGAIVLTFNRPFMLTGNGYFATWIAAFCSVALAYGEFVGGPIPVAGSLRRSFSFKPMLEDSMPPASTTRSSDAV